MTELVTAAIGLASGVLQLINSEIALKYVNELKDLETELQAEEAKGYNSDDPKIEFIRGQIAIIVQACQGQLQVFAAQKTGAIPAISAASSPPHPV